MLILSSGVGHRPSPILANSPILSCQGSGKFARVKGAESAALCLPSIKLWFRRPQSLQPRSSSKSPKYPSAGTQICRRIIFEPHGIGSWISAFKGLGLTESSMGTGNSKARCSDGHCWACSGRAAKIRPTIMANQIAGNIRYPSEKKQFKPIVSLRFRCCRVKSDPYFFCANLNLTDDLRWFDS